MSEDRYQAVVGELLTLAREASVLGRAGEGPGRFQWSQLSSEVYSAVFDATETVLGVEELCDVS